MNRSEHDPAVYLDVVADGEPTLVLLHGLMSDHAVFDELTTQLRDRFRVLAIDLPGFGRSAPPPDYSAAVFADAIAGLIGRVAGGRAIVLGWSMGATAALQLALDHPELVERLVLTGATPCLTQRPDWPWGV